MNEADLLRRLQQANEKYGFVDNRDLSAAVEGEYAIIDGGHVPKIRPASLADLAFATQLDYVLQEIEKQMPGTIEQLGGHDEVVAVDLGCGTMPYAGSLMTVLASINGSIVLYGVDNNPEAIEDFYKGRNSNIGVTAKEGDIEKLHEIMAGYEKDTVELLFLFNPSPKIPFPELKKINSSLTEHAILIGSADGVTYNSPGHYMDGLRANNYRIIVMAHNPFGEMLNTGYWWSPKSFTTLNFSPWFVAVPEAA